MSNTLTQTEASAVPVASKAPSTFSSCDTARVVSRKLNKGGFVMAKKIDRWTRSDGFYVKRLGCSSTVYVDYHIQNPSWIQAFSSEKVKTERQQRNEKLLRAIEFLRAEGYAIDDKGYIQCQVSY